MANTIVFIDSHISDNESLMLTRSSALEYRVLDEHRDGIEQMVDALAGQNRYDSIQIISHGAPGSITIGDTVLDHSSLSQYADQLATLGKALTTDGDLLLYGCNVGAGEDGLEFVNTLAQLMGADVTASDDLTGSVALGGDWLEVHSGTIESVVQPMAGFNGVLGNTSPTFINSNGKVTTDFGSYDDAHSVTVQSDGKILVASSSGYDFALARYNSEGSLDTTFNAFNTLNETATYLKNGRAVVLDSDVQIFDTELAASNSYAGASLTLARHGGASTDDRFSGLGIVATTSGTGGIVTMDGTDIATSTWTAGTLTLVFNNNATQALVNHAMQSFAYENASDTPPPSVQIDWTFKDDDSSEALTTIGSTLITIYQLPTFTAFTDPVTTTAEDHAVKISCSDLLAHSNSNDADGTVDSFTVKALTSGTLTIGHDASTATVWNTVTNKTIDATHHAWWTPTTNANGTLNAFTVVARDNDGGESITEIPVTVTVSSENDAPAFMACDGKVTTDFGSSDYGNSVTVQTDGKILVAGSNNGDFAVVRYNRDGSLDTSFSSNGIVTTDFGSNDYGNSITMQTDGKILVAGLGNGNFVLARYNSDGSLDTFFDNDGKLATDLGEYDYGHSIALQPDGKILV
ncbi:MAG: DUF4347 domain-containing protein, partial [Chlorobium sp.]|nr:DUF4347 domain-containing protein [Chlorobium sp.]